MLLICARGLSQLTRLPGPSTQFLLGALAAHGVVALGFDTGLRYDSFHDLVFYLLLPILIFGATQALDFTSFRKALPAITSLAVVGVLLTALLVAALVYYGINHPVGFPWPAALITGILLAATDPTAITGQTGLARSATQRRAVMLLEGESLLNDAASVVLFSLLLGIALRGIDLSTGLLEGLQTLSREVLIGLLIGVACGLFSRLVWRWNTSAAVSLWMSLCVSFAAYHAALSLHASGVVACMVCGFMIRYRPDVSEEVTSFWRFLAGSANGFIFVLMGATITLSMFTERWLAMLIAIAAVVMARFVSVLTTLRLTPTGQFNLRESVLISAMGMRGAVTLALALMLPTELPYWWTIQSIAYGVVLFDLFLMAPVAPILFRRLLPPPSESQLLKKEI